MLQTDSYRKALSDLHKSLKHGKMLKDLPVYRQARDGFMHQVKSQVEKVFMRQKSP